MKHMIALIVILCLTVTSIPAIGYAAVPEESSAVKTTAGSDLEIDTIEPAGEESASEVVKDLSEVTEDDIIEDASSESVTTYDLGGGQRASIFYSYNVRYENEDGELASYDPELVEISKPTILTHAVTAQGESLSGYRYENRQGNFKNYIPETLSESTPIRMEYDQYAISMTPTGYLNSILAKSKGKLENDLVRAMDNSNQNKKTKMVFGTESDEAYVEYISLQDGLKENIVLNEIPKKNEFTFQLTLKGLTYATDESGGITFYDENTGDIVAGIEAPFMNDATGDAYSENVVYTMQRRGNSDNYLLTVTVDSDYLNSAERVYPVTIDPSITWDVDSGFREAYVNSGSPNTKYYSSSYRVMPSGRGSSGNKYRTYLKFLNLRSTLKGATISSATLNCYENGEGNASQVVRVYKVLEDWDYTNITWNTVPDHGTATSYLAAVTSSGTNKTKKTFNIKSWVQSVVMQQIDNYGLVIKNQVEASTSYVEFYGTRSTTTAYRPYLAVTYTADEPAIPTVSSVTGSRIYVKGNPVKLSWTGMTCNFLDHVEYKITKADADGNTGATITDYTKLLSTSSSSGQATIPGTSSLAVGYYQIFIRGVSEMGTKGTGRIYNVQIVRDRPATPTVTANATYAEGSDITVSWTGLTGNNLAKLQYRIELSDEDWNQVEYGYVPYTTFTTSPTASGSLRVPNSASLEPGYYKIFIRGVNSSGVHGIGGGCKIQVVENEAPEIDSILFRKNWSIIGENEYVSPGDIQVTVRMWDDQAIDASNLWYLLSKPSSSYTSGSLADQTVSKSGEYYTVSFNISEEEVQQTGIYALYFQVTDDSGNSTYDIQLFRIDATPPTGSISTALAATGESSDVLDGTAILTAFVSDAHSGVASSTLTLYEGTQSNVGTMKTVLASNNSLGKNLAFDSTAYADGAYTLKLDITDKVGNTAAVWKDIRIKNHLAKPTISVSPVSGNTELNVQWGYQTEMEELASLQYQLDGGAWTDIAITSKLTGNFSIPLPEDIAGTHTLHVRGIDTAGEYGETARCDFNIDTTAPVVAIDRIQRGIVSGTVSDDYLDSWTISVKERDNEAAVYTELTSGDRAVYAGRIGIADLSGSQYAADTWYTIKVEARDEAGNTSSDTFDVYKDANYESATLLQSEHRILRSLGQSLKLPNFRVSSTAESLEMKNGNLFTSTLWMVNHAIASNTQKYQTNFANFADGVQNQIAAAGKDASGNVHYSNDVYLDAACDSFSFADPAENQIEQTIQLSQKAVAFQLHAPGSVTVETAEQPAEPTVTETEDLLPMENLSETADENAETTVDGALKEASEDGVISYTTDSSITYYAKVGNGDYHVITPDTLTHIYSLSDQTLEADSLTIKAVANSAEALAQLDTFSVSLAVMDEETFSVSSAEGYWPENVSAQDKINYKTYVRWNTPETMSTGLSYEVHRSTISGFVPSEQTLVAENVTDGYWVDINTNYSISLYYKVRAVLKDANGNVITASSYSDLAESTPIDQNEYLKALGHKEYWAYADVATPAGSGYIEKSQGNFLYEQTDAEMANEQLPVSFTRTYNSLATSKSALGYGWTHSYDIELLRIGKDTNLDEGILVLRDGSGTIYQFKANGDAYISSLGKHVNLVKENLTQEVALPDLTAENPNQTISVIIKSAYTMTTRENVSYRFDESGKLVYMEESNGNILLFGYDEKRGLLNKITTGKGISVTFAYNDSTGGNDALTIRQMTLPDGEKVLYDYDASKLTTVTRLAAGEASGGITYHYAYNTSRKMTSLTDAKANTYSISYTDGITGEAKKFTYPAAGGNAESIQITRDTANQMTTTEKLVGAAVVKTEKDYFDGAGLRIRSEAYSGSGSDSYVTSYEYKDSLLQREISSMTYSVLSSDTENGVRTISTATAEKINHYTYDEDELLTQETEEGNTRSVYVYGKTGVWNRHLPTEYVEYVQDEDGEEEITAHEYYEYDAYGNLIQLRDEIGETVTIYAYYTGASDQAKGAVKSEKQYLLKNGSYSAATLISSTDTEFAYQADGTKMETVTTLSDENQTVSITTHDVMGRTLAETKYVYTNVGTANQTISKEVQSYTYDGYGRVTGITTTSSLVDSTLADIADTTFTEVQTKAYDDNGTLTEETTADGITTSYTYDALNRVISTTKESGSLSQTILTTYGYGNVSVSSGKPSTDTYTNAFVTTQTADGKIISQTYQDGVGRVVRSINDGVTTDYSYDPQGNRVTELVWTDANGNGRLIYHVLDENGRETATVYNPVWNADQNAYTVEAGSIVETSVYDKSGNLLVATDGEGNVTEYTYDEQGRLIKVILVDGTDKSNVTTYAYTENVDAAGNYTQTVTRTDAKGGVSVETSDASGNVIRVSDKGNSSDVSPIETTYTYDANGNLLKEVHQEGDSITYTYDSKDRLVTKTQYNASGSAVYQTEYTYYGNDLLKEMRDYTISGGTKTRYHYTYRVYDGLKRLIKQAEVNGSNMPSNLDDYAATYTYDLNDHITEITYGSAMGTEVSAVKYVYTSNRLAEVRVKVGSVYYTAKKYAYNPDGSTQTVEDYYNFRAGDTASHLTLTYSYDAFGRVSGMDYTNGANTIESHSYQYDKNNQIVEERNVNVLDNLNEVCRYQYNHKGELISSKIYDITTRYVEVETGEEDEDGNIPTEIVSVTEETAKLLTSYTYDKVGNRTEKVENGVTTTYAYNSLNQLRTESGANTLTYDYDGNGNQISVSGGGITKTYTYTPAGMLASYTSGSDTQTNLYNGDGQRVQKKEGSAVTNYFYQNGSVLYTTDSTGALKAFYLLNVSDAFATSRIESGSEAYYFYTEDQRGSTVNVLDKDGNRVVSYWYSDFGEVSESKASAYSSFENEIQYTGAIYDELTGLLYLNARFYDPSTGRFLTQDTYRGERSDADTWHLYAYCANNPINYVDPSGHNRTPIRKTILAFGLDIFFSVAVPYIAGPLDLWGNAMKKAVKLSVKPGTRKIGERTVSYLWDDLLNGPIPQIKGYMGRAKTQIRKAIWRFTGVTVPNVWGTGMSKSLGLAVRGFSDKLNHGKTADIVNFLLNFASLGSIVALLVQLGDSEKPKKKGFAGILEDGIGEFVYIP